MKRILGVFLCIFIAACCVLPAAGLIDGGTHSVAQAAAGDEYVYLGGIPIGISVNAGGLIVVSSCDVQTDAGAAKPVPDGALVRGDILLSANGAPLVSLYQLRTAVENSDGDVLLSVKHRDGSVSELKITPALDKSSGQKRIGVVAKEDVSGVGTLTFVTENGRYGALGHRISDGESGTSSALANGKIYPVSVDGVVKGENGKAGGLSAELNRLAKPIGNVEKNTNIGIYGEYYETPVAEKIRVAKRGEAVIGKAQILTTVSGTEPKLYDVDVVKVVSQSASAEKGLVLSVRDRDLIEKTGGIVQGMSGSPIIQNGVLIGAVTHVFLNDATRGYGVHSRFMYAAAQETPTAERLAA